MDDPKVIAALIAGLVSLVGILASIVTTRLTWAHEKKKMVLSLKESSLEIVFENARQLSSSLETVRTSSWRLLGSLWRLRRGEQGPEECLEYVTLLSDSLAQVDVSWPTLKASLNPSSLDSAIFQYHEFRHVRENTERSVRQVRKMLDVMINPEFYADRKTEIEWAHEFIRRFADEKARVNYGESYNEIDTLRNQASTFIQYLADLRESDGLSNINL